MSNDPIENKNIPEEFKSNEYTKLDRIVQENIRMHLFESMYYTVRSCSTTFQLWKTLSGTHKKKVAIIKIYLIWCLYNLQMKESNSFQAYLNKYESINSQISAQGMTINDELKVVLLMSSFPPSWGTFVMIVCSALATTIKYSEITSTILFEDAQRKTFTHESTNDAFMVQSSADRPNSRGQSSFRQLTNARG